MRRRSQTLLEALRKRYPHRPKEELLARVLCGEVLYNGECFTDPKTAVAGVENAEIDFLRRRYVSRGGAKLEAALHRFRVIPAQGIFVDAGASTGGFTDCLLKHGAALVHAVDVGRNELAPSLREDPRVVAHEGVNIMSLDQLDPQPQGAVCDISFRSARGVIAKLLDLTGGGEVVALIKPQFEVAGRREDPAFDGVVRDRSILEELFRAVVADLESDGVWAVDWMFSPLEGRRGNREAFFRLRPAARAPGRHLRPEDIVVS